MELVDGDGYLLGVVNLVDAVVVVLVVSAIAGGVALLDPFEADRRATRYATVDFGAQPSYVAGQIAVGDRLEEGAGNATVTDVHYQPAPGGNVSVAARLRLRGRLAGDAERFRFGGEPVRLGTEFTFETARYSLDGTVVAVADGGPDLDTASTPVVVEGVVPTPVAEALAVDDAARVAGQPVATVESVAVYPTNASDRKRAVVGLTLSTIERGGTPVFGNRPVEVGRHLELSLGGYSLDGVVVRRGSTDPPGTLTTRVATVRLSEVPPEIAAALHPGLTESTGGRAIAHVRSVRVRPANVTLTSRDGQIHERQHPRLKDVRLTVSLSVRRTRTGLRFHGRQVTEGSMVVLDFGTVTVRGRVVDIREEP